MLKLYCYTDETGQDTKGKLFLVSIVLAEKDNLEMLKEKITEIETSTKGSKKWTKTNDKKKILFIKTIIKLKFLRGSLYYSVYENTIKYTPLVALAISKAVYRKIENVAEDYRVNIVIDDLRETDGEIVRKELKALKIHYNKIKVGLKDEQDILIRFADAIAGFIRDYLEKRQYAVKLMSFQAFNNFFKAV